MSMTHFRESAIRAVHIVCVLCALPLSMISGDSDKVDRLARAAADCATTGRTAEAIEGYHAALAVDPHYVPALDELAWIRATSSEPQFRDGVEAEALATHLVELTHYKFRASTGGLYPRAFKIHASHTLAAAFAANGKFTWAVGYAKQSLETAERLNQISPSPMAAQLVADAKEYLKIYQSSSPFIAPPGYRRTPVPSH